MARTVDKSKKSNIKCEHCKYCHRESTSYYGVCNNSESKKYDTMDIEDFRDSLENVLTKTVTKPFQFRLAEKYGIVEYKPHKIKFYFEDWGES